MKILPLIKDLLTVKAGPRNTITTLSRPVIGYKKVYCLEMKNNIIERCISVIVKLQIPAGATVRWGNSDDYYKNRASCAKIISVYMPSVEEENSINYFKRYKGKETFKLKDNYKLTSIHTYGEDKAFDYKLGETVYPTEEFLMDEMATCAPGIHFFLRRSQAEDY